MRFSRILQKAAARAALGAAALCGVAGQAEANFVQTNLVSDIARLATITDPELVNSWGLSHSATSPFWISNQGKSTATLYAVTGATAVSKIGINPPDGFVAIPTTASGPQGPTGQVNNSNASSFLVGGGGDGKTAHFIFANLNGTISAWDGGKTAFIQPSATTAGAVFTGLAINQAQTRLYAADDAGAGSIDVFDSAFAPAALGATAFANPFPGLVPFNVQDIGGKVYVAYAPPGRPNQQNAALGAGAVAVFDEDGNLLDKLIDGSHLAAPWGIALAAAGFGEFGNDLLVGNFSYLNSEINAFDPLTGAFKGTIPIAVGAGNTPGGLWALGFGTGASNGSPNTLYFTDGINGEAAGLFAALNVPEPSTIVLLAAALALLGVWSGGLRRSA